MMFASSVILEILSRLQRLYWVVFSLSQRAETGQKADMLLSTTPSTLALIPLASLWYEASLLLIHDSPSTSLTLWQSDGPSF